MCDINSHDTVYGVLSRVLNGDFGYSYGQISGSDSDEEQADARNLAEAVAAKSDTAQVSHR